MSTRRMRNESLLETLKRHEGFRRLPYRDSVGKLTIGYGRNLDDVGVSEDEAEAMLVNDMTEAMLWCAAKLAYWPRLSPLRKKVLGNMRFNLGARGLLGFKRMHAALERGDYQAAANEMADSRWYWQVGGRAVALIAAMRAG